MLINSSVSEESFLQEYIHVRIALQVEKSPDAIAVISDGKQLTYRELNQQANQLAHYLHALDVQPETLVGIYMSRSVDMIIGILGILKVGGAYVPLDPAYPKERLALILEETQATVLVTQEHLAKDLPTSNAQIINFDTTWDAIASNSTANLNCEMSAETLAYVMYTSGSTGKPKGVQITHANIHHYVQALGEELQLRPSDVYLHTASFSFSSSVRQLIVPLSLGATVVLTTVDQLGDPFKLFQFIKIQGVTIVDFVPSYWRRCTEILRNLEDERRRNLLDNRLRLALSASEPLLSDIPRIWQVELKPEIRFVNMYGQTETSGIIATYSIPQTNEDEVKVVPIGKPIANTQIFLLNDELVPVTDGETGEIYIGGLTLGKGYLNRPDLTKERFTNDPLSSALNTRLYKTGDLGRRLPDGAIAFAGRLDYQVKIRGKRVELGEIETSLALHPNVKQTVVVGNEAPSGDIRLIAYIVPESPLAEVNQVEFVRELRGYLQQRLPDYMVPNFFVRLSAFPLTPNGKIDRKSLPTLEQTQKELETTYICPRNDVEVKLTEIWQKVLSIPQIGIQDSFFELGGTSLLAVHLFNEIEKVFGRMLSVSTLLEHQTIEQLANLLQQKQATNFPRSLILIQPGDPNLPALFCIHAMWGNALSYHKFIRYLQTNRPCYGLQAVKQDKHGLFPTTVEEMASHYIEEIRSVQPEGPYYFCGHSFGGLVAFEMAQQLSHQGREIALLGLIDCANSSYAKPTHNANPGEKQALRRLLLFHLKNLLNLTWSKRLVYLQERLDFHWRISKYSLLYRLYLRYVRRDPYKLQLLEIARINIQATKKYTPQTYNGQLTIFQALERQVHLENISLLGWEGIAGSIDLHIVPGCHTDIMQEPNVQELAKKFARYTEKA